MEKIKIPDCVRCDNLTTDEKWGCDKKGKIPAEMYEGGTCDIFEKALIDSQNEK